MTLSALFVDFDSFFASVEQAEDPDNLAGRPVAVVPLQADTTCCIAASYEAKAFGVKTGTGVAEARRLCPGIVFVQARHEVYIAYHHKLLRAIESCIPIEEVASIDEVACRLTGTWQRRDRAEGVAAAIKAAVRQTAAVTCSIGIAPNRFLAKTASKMDKPDGITVLEAADLPGALYRLELGDLNGVGPRMLARLRAAGIRDVRALCAAGPAELAAIWGGVGGERMHAALRGAPSFEGAAARATVGHSHVLPPDMRRDALAVRVAHRLLQKAAWRLRGEGMLAGGMTLGLGYVDGRRWQGKRRLDASDDTLALSRILRALWDERPRRRAGLLKVGVTLTHLSAARGRSLDLFGDGRDRRRLNAAVDALNGRFGKQAVYLGGAHGAMDAAPMRIAFTRIPDPVVED